MDISSIKYIIISPVRNEEKNIEKTLESVVSQTMKPIRWVIVNDGSSDGTADIVEKYAVAFNWISLIILPDRGYYDLMSGGEIKAFYRGYDKVRNLDFHFLAKLDGDVSFDERYFENLFREFYLNNKLGIASGACYYYDRSELVLEQSHKRHVRGAARVYRKQCWEDIGGVIDDLGWDAIDVYKARLLGWDTYSFEKMKVIHHVKTWAKGGLLHGRMRSGRMYYLMGAHPVFFGARVIGAILESPFMFASCAMAYGYLKAFLLREKRVVDQTLMNYIRKEQLERLIKLDVIVS